MKPTREVGAEVDTTPVDTPFTERPIQMPPIQVEGTVSQLTAVP